MDQQQAAQSMRNFYDQLKAADQKGFSALTLMKRDAAGQVVDFSIVEAFEPAKVLEMVQFLCAGEPNCTFELYAATCPQEWKQLDKIANLNLGWSLPYLKDPALRQIFRNPLRQ